MTKYFKQLPALLTILETRNLTKAAQQLNVTQSAMSKTLRQIRDMFNDPILVRHGNHYILTQRGEQLKRELPPLMDPLYSLLYDGSFDHTRSSRTFTLASCDYTAQYILPLICHNIADEAPDIPVKFKLWEQSGLRKLSHQDQDVVITTTVDIPDNLYGRQLAEDRLVIMMRKDHPFASEDLQLTDYIAANHIAVCANGDADHLIEQLLANHGLQRKIVVRLPLFMPCTTLVEQSDVLLTLPAHVAATLVKHSNCVVRSLPFHCTQLKYYIFWHAKHQHDPAHQWFRAHCSSIAGQHFTDAIQAGMNISHSA